MNLDQALREQPAPPDTRGLTGAHEGTVRGLDTDGLVVVDVDQVGTVHARVLRPIPAVTVPGGGALVAATPPAGARCLLVFARGDARRPWIVGFA